MLQEGRIMNDENISIKGFIPIVGIKDDSKKKDAKKADYSAGQFDEAMLEKYLINMAQSGQFGSQLEQLAASYPQHIAQPEDQRGLAAALQGLIGSGFNGPKKPFGLSRPQKHFGAMKDRKDCVCVPFYMCKNGFIVENGQNSPAYGQSSASYGQSSFGQFSPILSQLQDRKGNYKNGYPSNQKSQEHDDQDQGYLPIDERSLDKLNDTFTEDLLGRMLGAKSISDGCGVLRTCCQKSNGNNPMISGDFTEQVYPGEYLHHLTGGRPHHGQMKPQRYPQHQQQQHHYQQQHQQQHQYGQHYPQMPQYGQPGQHSYDHPKRHGQQFNPTLRPPLPYQRPPKMIDSGLPQGYPSQYDHSGSNSYLNPVHKDPFMSEAVAALAYDKCGTRATVGITGRVQNLNYHQSATEFGEFPWQVAILKKLGPSDNLYVCGGALISSRHILTAAHCLKKLGAGDIKVRLGEWDVHREDEFYAYIEKNVEEITVHPHFSTRNLANDVAILRMEHDVDLSQQPHISPICLADLYDNYSGQRCFVSGWGKTAFGKQGDYQSVLMKVDLPVIDNPVCESLLKRTRLGHSFRLDKSMMCAGGEAGKDACEGDGGSGLVCEVNGNWKVAGLVSWGLGCGQASVPGVYTNIAALKPWIDRTVLPYYHQALQAKNAEKDLASLIQERSIDGASSSNSTVSTTEASTNTETTTVKSA